LSEHLHHDHSSGWKGNTSSEWEHVSDMKTAMHESIPTSKLGVVLQQKNGVAIPISETSNAAPMALRTDVVTSTPNFSVSDPGTVRISHREMVTSVTGTENVDEFKLNFRVQPANFLSFPWLSQIANMFETYTFLMLKVIYVPRVPTTTAGQIGLALDFDSDDIPASTLTEFSQFKNSAVGSIWSGLVLEVSGDALQKCVRERYTDHGVMAHPYDPILHDVANLRIAVLSPSVAGVYGQIYFEYDIVLRTPEPVSNKYNICRLTSTNAAIYGVPLGSSATTAPVVAYADQGIPVLVNWSVPLSSHCIRIPIPGRFLVHQLVQLVWDPDYWSTAIKAHYNTCCRFELYRESAGISIWEYWQKLGEDRVEVHSNSADHDYCLMSAIVDQTVANTGFYFSPIILTGAGITANAVVTRVFLDIMPWYYAGGITAHLSNPNAKYPTLTNQQRCAMLNGVGGWWSDLVNGGVDLAGNAIKGFLNVGGSSKKKSTNKPRTIKKTVKKKKQPKIVEVVVPARRSGKKGR
jgi:hypothetical protein